ncbi:MAG: hypothetical protein NC911_00265 [Candidatus Omnitrophica bacterium]|nr:hypothetical protein [Candidatus Omnitrophota bacterium]
MKKDSRGGGHTITGLNFEKKVNLQAALASIPGYQIQKVANKAGHHLLFKGKLVARCFKKHEFYEFLKENNIQWRKFVTRRLLPDDALLVVVRRTLFIIEMKYQQVSGSVDEKLQTSDFKKRQYTKLVSPLGLQVKYVYLLSNWFKKPEYADVLDYIKDTGCHYFFNELPLIFLGLPEGEGH